MAAALIAHHFLLQKFFRAVVRFPYSGGGGLLAAVMRHCFALQENQTTKSSLTL